MAVGLSGALQVAASSPGAELGYGWALAKMLLALVVVCVAAYLALRYGLKRLGQGRTGAGLVRVIERRPLSSTRAVSVVEIAGRYLVVGEAEGGISTLAELDAEAVEARRARGLEGSDPPSPSCSKRGRGA